MGLPGRRAGHIDCTSGILFFSREVSNSPIMPGALDSPGFIPVGGPTHRGGAENLPEGVSLWGSQVKPWSPVWPAGPIVQRPQAPPTMSR